MAHAVAFTSPDAPESERWIGFLYSGTTRLPVAFPAPTKAIAVRSAEAFWTAEIAKEAAKRENAARMSVRRRKETANV